ncbi:hypothetical protein JHK82_028109 [Glycine max]|nr:hypothetical protein JHK85_028776 [Glycine max]KAG5127274.1 hypothetical protein JHK82_028109 [Glycine max]KAG5151891.1 hypothetical protein JHK84_028363 [Glycine max]
MISASGAHGLGEKGLAFYEQMEKDGIRPNKQDMEHYLCMVDLIGTTGDLDGAYKFITRMHMTPDANVLGSLLGACRLHNKVKLA